MTRIFPAHTYGEGPRAGCYWPSTTAAPDFPQAAGKITCDVAIIGAGFTGVSTALHLAQNGADVVVVDAKHPGWGASGRNGGFCCLGGAAAGRSILRGLYGEAARREWCETEKASVDFAEGLINEHNIDCDRHSNGETLMAHTPKAWSGFESEARKLTRDFGVQPELIGQSDLARHGLNGPFYGAMTMPIGFALNPLKYVLGLARAASDQGAQIYGQSPVTKIDQSSGFTLTTRRAQINAKRLVVATNGYSSDDLPDWMRARYIPTQSNVIVTRELTDSEIAAQGWSSQQMCFDDRFFMHYFRLMPNRRMLFGMRGGLFSSAGRDKAMHSNIRKHFGAMFPAWAHVETPYSWNGLLSISRDLTPYAGPIPEMPGAFTALSYHGNGVVMASYAGSLLAEMVQGRKPSHLYPAILQKPPKRFPLGRYRRASLWPIYAWATLRGA